MRFDSISRLLSAMSVFACALFSPGALQAQSESSDEVRRKSGIVAEPVPTLDEVVVTEQYDQEGTGYMARESRTATKTERCCWKRPRRRSSVKDRWEDS